MLAEELLELLGLLEVVLEGDQVRLWYVLKRIEPLVTKVSMHVDKELGLLCHFSDAVEMVVNLTLANMLDETALAHLGPEEVGVLVDNGTVAGRVEVHIGVEEPLAALDH